MLGLKRGTVRLRPHDRRWKAIFEIEKARIMNKMGGLFLDVQHVGSTSVPGLVAKPIIDLDAGVVSTRDFKKIVEPLARLGYEQVKNKSAPHVHLVFGKGSFSKRTHFLHVIRYRGVIWCRDILFRDYLRTHSSRARAYAALKTELAMRYPKDRMAYTKGKKDFILRTIVMAEKISKHPQFAKLD